MALGVLGVGPIPGTFVQRFFFTFRITLLILALRGLDIAGNEREVLYGERMPELLLFEFLVFTKECITLLIFVVAGMVVAFVFCCC